MSSTAKDVPQLALEALEGGLERKPSFSKKVSKKFKVRGLTGPQGRPARGGTLLQRQRPAPAPVSSVNNALHAGLPSLPPCFGIGPFSRCALTPATPLPSLPLQALVTPRGSKPGSPSGDGSAAGSFAASKSSSAASLIKAKAAEVRPAARHI